MPDATLRQLEYFIAAVEEGSVTAAAQRLHLSQSALSMALGELERALGVQVLVRHRRGVRPTRIGEQVLVDARRLLVDLVDLQTSARESQFGLTGKLMVGCYSTLSPMVLPPVLSEYVVRFPRVDLTFTEGPHDVLIENLRNGTLDLALLYDYGSDLSAHRDDLETETVVAAPPYVLLAEDHPLGEQDAVALRQLVDQPMILFSLPPGGDYFLSLFKSEGLEPRVRYRATNFELVRSLVARRLGYSILSQRTRISMSYEGRRFITRPLQGDHPGLAINAVTPAGTKLTRPAAAFIETFRAVN
ncbi:LysR family transcriptional regulator [Mycobacterium sp. URHD0025]|uniref:LysR family transcriptional regulator n=1 Tax=Mycobacterium sp. URHD0025 TaxID=1298864 RepID=UPI0003F7B527|nr:LysR family transcriptional regulator [Mycobacterium sp. URHD0025]